MANLPAKPASYSQAKLILKTILITLLVLLISTGLVYVGYWYGKKQTKIEQVKPKASPLKEQVKEVPFGDEDFESDEEYQKFMEEYGDEGCTGEECSWITYKNETHGFSFQYPSTVFLEETNGVNLPLVYLDTKMIVIPPAYGGFLTPVEINARGDETYQQAVADLNEENLFQPGTSKRETLSPPLKGIRVSGICQGFPCDGQEHHMVYLDGLKGLIIINYTPNYTDPGFPKPLFNKILQTFRSLD